MIQLFEYLQNKTHVIFDYNGTILYDTDLCVESINQILTSHELGPLSETRYRELFHMPIASFYQKIGLDFQRESFDQLGQRYMSLYLNQIHRCRVYEGLRELLAELRQHAIRTSILTALHHDALHEQLESFEIKHLFDAAFGLPDYRAHSKIERGLELMAHMGIPASETIVIGDTDHDFEVAQALGTDVILLADGHQNEMRLRKTGAIVVNLQRQPEKRRES